METKIEEVESEKPLETWRTTSEYFEKALEHYLPLLEIDSEKVSRVASVGCGYFLEAQALKNVFNRAEIVGIDRNREALESITRHRVIPGDVEVKVMDLRESEDLISEKLYDIIIVRNPDIRLRDNWLQIFKKCRNNLCSQGILFVTTPTEFESERVREVMRGFEIKIAEENKRVIPKTAKTAFRDNYVVVAQKR